MILDAIKAVAGLGDKALALIPDENQRRRLDAEWQLAVLRAEGEATRLQAGIVQEHGKSASLFVSGYRPMAAWVCVAAMSLYVLIVVANWVLGVAGETAVPLPDFEWLWPLLVALLGLGGLRTTEKVKGVARDSLEDHRVIDAATRARWAKENDERDRMIADAERRVAAVEAEQRERAR